MNEEQILEIKNSIPKIFFREDSKKFQAYKKKYAKFLKDYEKNLEDRLYKFDSKISEFVVLNYEKNQYFYKILDKDVLDELKRISFTNSTEDSFPLLDVEKLKKSKGIFVVFPPDKTLNLFYSEIKIEDYEDPEDYIDDEDKLLTLKKSGDVKFKEVVDRLKALDLENSKKKILLKTMKEIAYELGVPTTGSKQELKVKLIKEKQKYIK